MNVVLWVIAGVLAVVLLTASSKMFVSKEQILRMGGPTQWVEDFSPGALKALGALEFLGAIGLILPAVLDIAPILVPITATCVVLLFIGAVTVRVRRGEPKTAIGDAIYLVLATFLAFGRFGPWAF